MFKNVLILSDNYELTNRIDKLINKMNLESKIDFNYAISPFSDVKMFKEILNKDIHQFDLRINQDIEQIISNYDLVFSLHFKQIFPPKLVNAIKCINIHPGYNPINRGWYPQVFAIINDLPIGATIHEIDEQLDHGAIIDRALLKKYSWDTSESLYYRILDLEMQLIEKNINSILNNSYNTVIPEQEGMITLKKDFDALCELNLDEKATYGEVINRLRALSHGNFKNAYFFDEEKKKKVFVKIILSSET